MAVRIQFRRGTAAEWTSANPTLTVGELGYETDNQQFKIGDGSTDWANLSYAAVSTNYVDSAIANVVGLAPETLDTLNELAAAIGDDADFVNTINNSLSTHEDSTTNVHGIANTSALETQSGAQTKADNAQANAQAYADNAISTLVDAAPGTLDTLNELAAALGDDANFSTTITNNLAAKISFEADTNANIANNTSTSVANVFYFAADSKSIWIGDGVTAVNELDHVAYESITWAINTHNDVTTNVHGIADVSELVLQSDLADHANVTVNVHGIANTADLVVTANLTNHANTTTDVHGIANTADLVVTADLADYAPISNPTFTGTVGLPGDTSIGSVTSTEINYLDGVTSNLQNQIDEKAPLANATLTGDVILPATTSIGDIDATEISRLANVSSNIQDQLDAKLASADASNTYATIASPTFTGTVTLPSDTVIGDITSTELSYLTNVTSDIQTQIDDHQTLIDDQQDQIDDKLASTTAASTYAPIASPTFTGTVTLPGNTVIGDITSTELGYITNVTSDIQGQLDDKLASTDAANTYAPLNDPTLTGNVVLPTTTTIGDITSTELSYLTNVTSDIQSQLGGKLGVTAASTTYAPLANATLTGTVSLPATTSIGDVSATEIGYVNGVTSGIQTQLDAKLASSTAASTYAPLADATLTGTVTLPATTSIGDVSATEIGYVNGVTSSIQTQIDAKAPIANATFTGSTEAVNLTLTGNLYVQGSTTTISTSNLKLRDNMTYLNQAGLFDISGASGDGTNVVYTTSTSHDYAVGDYVTVANVTPSSFDIGAGDGHEILAITDNTFTVASSVTDTYTSGGQARGKIHANPDLGWAAGRYADNTYAHAGFFRDATDGTFKVFDGYVPEPDESAFIDTSHNTFALADFAAATVTAANVITTTGFVFPDSTIQTSAGVPSLTDFTEKTADYTLDTLDYKDNVVEMNSGSAMTFTIPTNSALAWPIGASMDIIQTGAGQVTISPDTGVTLNYTPGNKLRTQWSSCTIMKRATDSWILYGDLTA